MGKGAIEGADAVAAGQRVEQAGELRLARVEAVRAIAAVGVVVGHVWGATNGFGHGAQSSTVGRLLFGGGLGVFLFFGLSGYLIFAPFARRHFGDGRAIPLSQYARNRALRILPLYWIAIVIVLILQEGGGSSQQWWRFMLFAQNYSLETKGTVDGALWSVVVEIQFYVLLPLLAVVLAAVSRRRKDVAAGLIAALGLASYLLWHQKWQVDQDQLWRVSFPATFFFFTGGMLLALYRVRVLARRPAWMDGPFGRAELWLVASVALYALICADISRTALMVVVSPLVIGTCVLPLRQGAIPNPLDWRPLALVGVASYSVYVWQEPVLRQLSEHGWLNRRPMLVGAPLLAIAVGLVSYRLIESPFLRLRGRWTSQVGHVEPRGHHGGPRVAEEPSAAG